MITLNNVYKSYGELKVLRGIDLDIHKSEIISLTGPSGAGKSTLMHIIGTLDKPDSGNVKFHNIDVLKLSDKKLSEFRNKNIGFIFQFHHLLQEFTALENICIPAYIAGKQKKETELKALELLEILSLKDRAEHKPSELSGGEQQRVAVARSLINNPEIILADEPSGNLDSENAFELHKLFFELRKSLGITCVIVTHNDEFAKMADRQLKMIDGCFVEVNN
ncbi:MAG: ABC transporter ATP-binding protein [Bacteroidales bacterium]|nr:ABC transporter ATP-binding protein [Bacteroidales bacterium]